MASLAALEEDYQQYREQLDIVRAQLKDDPENAELRTLYDELNDMVTLLDESIAEQKAKQGPRPAVREPTPPPPPPQAKWSRENHPAFKKASSAPTAAAAAAAAAEDKEEPAAPVAYQVNDSVLAKWISGDKAFYPARITSITGSSTAPIYLVKFKSYDTTETLRAKDIRPISNKRKADGTPASGAAAAGSSAATTSAAGLASPPPQASGVVATAAASMYPEGQALREAEKKAADAAGKPKAKKIKATRELEAGKNKWQEFSQKSKFGKTQKKDSMFRTGEGVNARVGFTGSGQAMRKDPTRSRHVYQTNEELD